MGNDCRCTESRCRCIGNHFWCIGNDCRRAVTNRQFVRDRLLTRVERLIIGGGLQPTEAYTRNSRSTFAAQMKSFSLRPPTECVLYFTLQRLYPTSMSG